jgi:hypothetical protein
MQQLVKGHLFRDQPDQHAGGIHRRGVLERLQQE